MACFLFHLICHNCSCMKEIEIMNQIPIDLYAVQTKNILTAESFNFRNTFVLDQSHLSSKHKKWILLFL